MIANPKNRQRDEDAEYRSSLCDQELLKGEENSGEELSLEEPAGNKLICARGHVHFIATDVHRRAVHKRGKKN